MKHIRKYKEISIDEISYIMTELMDMGAIISVYQFPTYHGEKWGGCDWVDVLKYEGTIKGGNKKLIPGKIYHFEISPNFSHTNQTEKIGENICGYNYNQISKELKNIGIIIDSIEKDSTIYHTPQGVNMNTQSGCNITLKSKMLS